jgi:EmrB/QacA subfamily drug resistance transporter
MFFPLLSHQTMSASPSTISANDDTSYAVLVINDPQPPLQEKPHVTTLPFKQLWIILVGLACSLFLSSLNQTMVATILPTIASEFKALGSIAWVATAYLLTSTITQPLAGKLSDTIGRKALMTTCMLIFLLGTMICALSTGLVMVVAGRAVQGMGGGGVVAMVQIILSDVVSIQDRGKYTGFIGAVWTISSIVGPLLGGVFADQLSWRWTFWINLPLGVVALVIVAVFLHLPGESWLGVRAVEGERWSIKLRSIDYMGAALLCAATTGFLLATSWGGHAFAWNSPVIIGIYSASAVGLVAFVLVEIYVAVDPLIPPRLFKVRNVSLVCLYSFLVGMMLFTLIFYIPIYFQLTKGSTATESGLQMLPLLLSTVVASILSGVLITMTGSYRVFVVLGAAFVAIGCGLMSTWDLTSNRGHEIGYMVLAGLGLGQSLQSALIAAQAAIEHKDIAVVTSLVGFSRVIGGVTGLAICSSVFTNRAATLLSTNLSGLPGITTSMIEALQQDHKALRLLPVSLQPLAVDAYVQALRLVFFIGIPLGSLAFLLSLALQHYTFKRRSSR